MDIYSTLKASHSHFRWLIFVALAMAIIIPLINKNTQNVEKKHKLPALFLMITSDIQLLLGLILYFAYSPFGIKAFSLGMGTVMKDSFIRKITIEHFTTMIIAVILIHIAYTKIKKATTNAQISKISLIYFGIGAILILAGIPWDRI